MPTCCAPGCTRTKESNPECSFFKLPWEDKTRISIWLRQLNLKHKPARQARICHNHFPEKFLFVDPKYRIAPNLYPRTVYRLTDEAYPIIDNKETKERESSVNRKRKREHEETVHEALGGTTGAAQSSSSSQHETTEDQELTANNDSPADETAETEEPLNASYLEDKCMCRCMCRRCTIKPVNSVGTQTDWNTYVKAIQVRPDTSSKAVTCKPDVSHAEFQASVDMCDTGINTLPIVHLPPESHTASEMVISDSELTDVDIDNDLTADPDYVQSSSDNALSSPTAGVKKNLDNIASPDQEMKYLVFESSLRELFVHCPRCGHTIVECEFDTKNMGTLLKVKYSCENGHKGIWLSQPLLKYRMAAGNLLLSAAILFTGGTYEKMREIADVLHMPIMCENHFYTIQEKYLLPVVHTVYTNHKEAIISAFGDDPVTLVGDGRCDSPGFSAKYGTYSIMEASSGAVLTFALGQVKPGTSSVALETNGCTEALTELQDCNMNVEVFGTDCSASIAKLLRESFPEILHEHDVYHIEKRIRKKLVKKASQRGNNALFDWIKPTTNQLWWVAQNCNQDPVELREKWISSIYHVTDQHEWDHFDKYHECAHAPLSKEERRKKKWLKPDSETHKAFKNVIMDQTLVKDIQKLTRAVHTGSLEAFHSLIIKYCPKRQHFSYRGMVARTELAILDLNNNLGRVQAKTSQGILRYNAVYPKRTKEWVAKPITEPKSHAWRHGLTKELLRVQCGDITVLQIPVPDDLPKNIAGTPRPAKEEVVQNWRTRFATHFEADSSSSDSE